MGVQQRVNSKGVRFLAYYHDKNRKTHHVGTFDNEADAKAAADEAKERSYAEYEAQERKKITTLLSSHWHINRRVK